MKSVSIRDLKNNPSTMTNFLTNGELVFVTKHNKPIGVTLPIDNSIKNQSLKEILYFNLYKNNEISFGKLAELLNIKKDKLREMFASLDMPVIDYNTKDVEDELIDFKEL
jgi:antitoxin (DNA-binding transcriptional repressor) of toxin-antitoxin stability system